MADGKFIAQSPGNTQVDEKKGRMQKEESCVGRIAPTRGSVFAEAKHTWFGVSVVVRKLEISNLGPCVEISVKVIGTAACLVASRPDP